MSVEPQSFLRDERGSVILEMTVTITVFLLVLFGIVEFSYLFYQWNTATKATQFGARLAAVSDPVAGELATLTGLSSTVLPGDPMPYFDYECSGNTGTCTNGGNYNLAAMQTLVFGRNADGTSRIACDDTPDAPQLLGMCNIYDKIDNTAKVIIRYEHTGLGYAGRPGTPASPGGAVPTITVRLTGINFNFVALDALAGLGPVAIPGLNTTITGEDLRASGN